MLFSLRNDLDILPKLLVFIFRLLIGQKLPHEICKGENKNHQQNGRYQPAKPAPLFLLRSPLPIPIIALVRCLITAPAIPLGSLRLMAPVILPGSLRITAPIILPGSLRITAPVILRLMVPGLPVRRILLRSVRIPILFIPQSAYLLPDAISPEITAVIFSAAIVSIPSAAAEPTLHFVLMLP